MKHLKLIFACLLTAIFSIGQVWAGQVTISPSQALNDGGVDPISIACAKGDGSSNPAISSGQLRLYQAASGKTTGNTITFSSESSITSIVFTFANNMTASNGSFSEGSYDSGSSTWTGSATSLTLTVTGTTSGTRIYITNMVVTYDDGGKTLSSVAVSGNPTKTSYYAGDNFDPTGLTVTGTYSDASTAPITSGITWGYNPSQTLALNQTSIGVTATVNSITSAEFTVSSLSVTEAPAAATYEKVTSTGNITDGDYLIVYEDGNVALNGALTSLDAVGNTVAVTINDGVITGSVAIDAATVTISTTAKTIQTASGYYIGITSYSNGLASSTSTAYEHQNISIDGGNAVIYFQQESWNSNKNGKMQLCYNSGSDQRRFRYFKEGSQKAIQLYKKVDATTIKPSAELAYAAADQKKLTKLGEAFTAPELSNPHTVTVTYASDNTTVAEVNASTGAVTINAAGVAVITASYDGSGDYKEGSASYTIGVTTHAGTEADPFDVADAKNVVDAVETLENAYATGIVCNVATSTLPAEGYISFYFSADGNTTGQQIEAYHCFGLNSAPFEAVTDVETGATVVVTGTLKKYQSTYEFDENCHLVSYTAPTAPKTPIISDIDNPITVASAITYIDAPATYDLSQDVWVRGVVTNIGQTSGDSPVPYIDVKDADVENSFRFFNYTINASITDEPQEGDILIATGLLDKYKSTYELNGCEVVSLVRPEVPVTGVALNQNTATIEVGESITLVATVSPNNASDKSITWSVQSGSDYASVDNGVVTGLAVGEAVIRAASPDYPLFYDECTVTVNAVDPTKHVVTFDATEDKTTENTDLSLTKGDLTIAITAGDGRFNNNTDYRVYQNATFTVSCAVGNITKIEMACASGNLATGFGEVAGLNGQTGVWTGNEESISFTASVKQVRINTITVTYKEDNRAASGLAWSTDAVELTVGETFTAPTLTNPNSISASAITIASDNTDLAVVNDGVVSLVENATGEATITATFAGNDDYKPATVSYTITVNAASPVLTDYFEKVTSTANIAEGTYLIVYEAGNLAFNGGLETLDAKNNVIDVEITNDNKIGVTTATEAATFYIEPVAGTIQAANGKYIGVTSNSNGLKTSDNADAYENAFAIDADGNAVISAVFENANMTMRYNKASDQNRFRYFGSGQQPIALYKLANEVLKQDPGISWDPESAELTLNDYLTPADYPEPELIIQADLGDNPLESITLSSDNESLATINKTNDGQIKISWVPDVTGTVHFTATYPGNDTYKAVTAVCTVTIKPANSIYVSPSLNVNFGSVEKDAVVADQTITVTLTGVDAATATLAGDASAFSISTDALTASGDITISASSATAGTFNATLTISDDAGLAASKVVYLSLTVTEPEIVDDLTGTWVLATAVPGIGEKFIVAGTYNSVTKTMGAQNANNRAAVESSLSEGVLTPGEGTKVFTLVDAGEGKFAIQASNGKYLSAAGTGTNNYLREAANYEAANAQWTISISEGIASVVASSSNRNDLQYNKSNPGLFSCYATNGQTAIQLFVQQSVTPPTPSYVDVRTGLEPNHYYTICNPNAMTSIEGATLWSFIGKDANFAYLVQESAPFEAGKPFIMYATASTVQAVLGDEVINPVANDAIHGTFEPMNQANLDLAASAAGHDLYLVIGDELRRVTGYDLDGITPLTGNSLAAQRAYVIVDEIPAAPANMPAHVRAMPMQGESAQGIENIGASEKPMKLMIDGQLFILRGEKMYDATGRLVK